jgi:hypothetical protein
MHMISRMYIVRNTETSDIHYSCSKTANNCEQVNLCRMCGHIRLTPAGHVYVPKLFQSLSHSIGKSLNNGGDMYA